jgi:hypothetical protein
VLPSLTSGFLAGLSLLSLVKDFPCESFTIDDPVIGTNTGSHLAAWAHIPPLIREAKDVHG